ncbi:MAG: WD40 repeat domain-containing protein [Opitutaceae bacterium]|nr:WD40 repeat domain-containing protein [Opitutaceae bacterium]
MNLTKAWAAQLDDYCIDLAWSPDGRVLASASAAGPVTLFDARGTRLHTLPGHADGTNTVAFAPAGAGAADPGPASARPATILASGGQDGCVRFWDSATGTQIAEANPGSAWIEHLKWQPTLPNLTSEIPNSRVLAAAAGRKLIFLRPDGSIAQAFKEASKTLSALTWHPQGGTIAAACFGGVCLWDAGDFHVRREYAYGSAIHALVWSPDGRWLVAGAQDNAVHLWIPEEDQEFHMSGYETKVRELSFSPDSRWLATGGARDACIWDCSGAGPEGREPLALPHSDRVCAVAFQQAHELLATAAGDGEVGLWSPTRSQPLVATAKLTAPVSKFAWSPDDSLLAIGSQQGGVLVLKVDA